MRQIISAEQNSNHVLAKIVAIFQVFVSTFRIIYLLLWLFTLYKLAEYLTNETY